MNTIRARQLFRLGAPRRNFTQSTRRNLNIEPPAPQPQEPKRPSKVGAFYKTFSAPLLKCFLGALFTYQLAYFGWMKLETIEETHNKKTEINGLREELAGAINNKRREAEGVVEKVGDKIGEAKDKVVESAEGAGVTGKVKKGDCIVTLGAGSITDTAKLIVFCLTKNITTPTQLASYALAAPQPPATITRPSIPLICIPTTLSGSEYFALAGDTNDTTHQKTGFLHSGMGASLVTLDPSLCLTTPSYHWLSTGVRTVDHCVEALCSLQATSESDERVERGLRVLVPELIACKEDGEGVDVAARK
ncbi:hypothetical protein E8E11_000671 [Didymella keratinophila]|nr:hypothetical protein E8E11_000671 [Didymella keratinophila]